jgi:hypothetical protein
VLRTKALAQQLAWFGSTPSSLYRLGPNPDLIGRPLSSLSVEPSENAGVSLDGRELLSVVDRHTDLLPTWIQGHLTGDHEQNEDLAVAVNGTIAAVTRSFPGPGRETFFSAMVPENALHNGHNTVAVLRVLGEGGTRRLEELRGSAAGTTTLVRQGGGEVIRSSDGTSIPVRRGALRGIVQFLPGPLLGFSGWAAQKNLEHRADSISVFADGHQVFSAPTEQLLPHRVFNQSGLFGFHFELPRGLLPPTGSHHRVRVFAVRLGVASELRLKRGWPWH